MPVRSIRRRYLWVHIETSVELDSNKLNKVIDAKIQYLFGVKGAVDMNYRLIEFFPEGNNVIVRCNHVMLTELRAALAHITDISGAPARFDVLRVSGTIKSLKRHFQRD